MNSYNDALIAYLRRSGVKFVLADVGASGDLWEPFQPLLALSDLLRFDPDLRAMRDVKTVEGCRQVTVNKVVIDNDAADATLFLTSSPYCSSTLRPDIDRIRDYAYEEWFEVKDEVQLPAITLDAALRENNLPRVDWLKLDVQGTEARILRSLSKAVSSQLVVCDVECSLYAHYEGADTLPEIHQWMLDNEFWIAEMSPHWNTRISKSRREELIEVQNKGIHSRVFLHSMHREPTTLEFTYARTIRGAHKKGFDVDAFKRLYACHFVLGAWEYCFEIASHMDTQHICSSDDAGILRRLALQAMEQRTNNALPGYLRSALVSRLARLFKT